MMKGEKTPRDHEDRLQTGQVWQNPVLWQAKPELQAPTNGQELCSSGYRADLHELSTLHTCYQVGSAGGLRSGGLPKGIGWFGVVAGLLSLCVAAGYVTKIGWLGETGLGTLAFVAVPAWLIWLGVVLWRSSS